jgi:hypothetical protein
VGMLTCSARNVSSSSDAVHTPEGLR